MGWNGSGGGSTPVKPKAAAKKPSPIRGLVAGLVVVALAVVAYFAFFAGSEKPQAERNVKDQKRIKTVKPAVQPKTNSTPRQAVEKVEEKPKKVVDGPSPDDKVLSCETNTTSGMIIERKVDSKGRVYRARRPLPSIFESESDTILSMVTADSGGSLPPVPVASGADLEKAFVESLKKPIVINETDSEAVKAAKERVIAAREAMDALMRQGKGFNEVIHEQQQLVRENQEWRNELRAEVAKTAKEDIGLAKEFCKKVNEELEKSGLEPISEPLSEDEIAAKVQEEIDRRELEKTEKKGTSK